MTIIIHRINTIEDLRGIPTKYGVEIDVRGYGEKMLLTHDPVDSTRLDTYDTLEDYLAHFAHAFVVFNLKEAGYEDRVLALAAKYNIKNYFLLDVEFPYLYRATRKEGVRQIAVRFSEAEPIEAVEAQIVNEQSLLDWVWIDTNTQLPLNAVTIKRLVPFKTCLVCPSRWGRPEDVSTYSETMHTLNFKPDAIMTSLELAPIWEGYSTTS